MILDSDDTHRPEEDYLHVGLIPDGTRRWARQNKVSLEQAYSIAIERLGQFVAFLFNEEVSTISVFLSSTLNLVRASGEVDAFCQAHAYLCSDILPGIARHFETKVRVVGLIEMLPDYLKDSLTEIETKTNIFGDTSLYLCVAYDPERELIEAFSNAPSPERFFEYLWVPIPLNMVVRTGQANLLSNFLPLQSAYARLYFSDTLFNDLDEAEMLRLLEAYRRLELKYGF